MSCWPTNEEDPDCEDVSTHPVSSPGQGPLTRHSIRSPSSLSPPTSELASTFFLSSRASESHAGPTTVADNWYYQDGESDDGQETGSSDGSTITARARMVIDELVVEMNPSASWYTFSKVVFLRFQVRLWGLVVVSLSSVGRILRNQLTSNYC